MKALCAASHPLAQWNILRRNQAVLRKEQAHCKSRHARHFVERIGYNRMHTPRPCRLSEHEAAGTAGAIGYAEKGMEP